jgi:hypothetical protein
MLLRRKQTHHGALDTSAGFEKLSRSKNFFRVYSQWMLKVGRVFELQVTGLPVKEYVGCLKMHSWNTAFNAKSAGSLVQSSSLN